MDARSVISNEDEDRRSVASTTATTASLASRIQSLAVDFGPKAGGITEGFPEGDPEDEEDEEIVEISEDQLLYELDRQEPAFQVCSRLFKPISSSSVAFNRLNFEQAESFQQRGYAVVDNFLTADHAARLRAETLAYFRQGRLQEASSISHENPGRPDRTARGDYILWLHPGTSAAASPSFTALLTAFKELQDDLGQILQLRHLSSEHQLSYYPASGSQYVRHRDAFPDDRVDGGERKVTAIVYANSGWKREDGGKLRLWPPKTDSAAGSQSSRSLPNGTAIPNGSAYGSANGSVAMNGRATASCDSDLRAPSDSPQATQQRCTNHSDALFGEVEDGEGLMSNFSRQSSQCPSGPDGGLPRSPKSVSSSVVAEPTDFGSMNDNASADSSSVRSGGRGEALGSGLAGEVGPAAVVDAAPLAGRLVLFLSGSVEHAVLPSFAERVAVTCWYQ